MIGQSSAADDFLVAGGILQPQLDETEEAAVILGRIDKLAFFFTKDMFEGNTEGGFRLIRRAHKNAHEDHQTGALHLGTKITERRLRPRNAVMIARMLEVVSVIQELLLHGKRISQRELYYLCIDSFDNQQQLNQAVLDVSAMLAVPRYALNIGAATRGVVAGCLRVATCGSVYHVDCKHVGTVRNGLLVNSDVRFLRRCMHCVTNHNPISAASQNGWPIPGDVREATSVVVASSARYILGMFSVSILYFSAIKEVRKPGICI